MSLNFTTRLSLKLPALAALAALFWLAFVPNSPALPPRQRVLDDVPAFARLQPVNRLPATNRLELEISLPLRNQEALTNLLRDLYNPASPNYHHYLTPEEFARQFGPSEADYQALAGFARAHGLTISATHPNRTILNVSGTVADVERALRVNLRTYRHPTEAREFFAPDAEPALDVAIPTLAVRGLDNFTLPRPMNLNADSFHHAAQALTNEPADATPNATGSGPRGNFLGKDFRAAYAPGVTLNGAGQSVGLVEFDGYYPNDVTTYENLAGLPHVALTNVLLNFSGNPGANNIEVALDIDMAVCMAPGLSTIVVYEGISGDTILNRMATDNSCRQLSCSWNFGPLVDATREQIFQQFAAQGQTMFVASGDGGAYSGTIPAPSDEPLATIVGGTSLTTGPNGAWVSETTWGGSGGGISSSFPIPYWQNGLNTPANQGSATFRNVPDVACLADGVIWLVANNGEQAPIGGTSAAAPLWAGFAALVNQQGAATGRPSIGFINPTLAALAQSSAYSTLFHDITTGNNFNSGSVTKFTATPGYDLCTGWGSPTGGSLISALLTPPDPLVITPTAYPPSVGAAGGPFTPAVQNFSLLNFGQTPINWTAASPAPWLTVSPTNGTLPTNGPPTTVAFSLNATALTLPPGTYTVAVWFTNLNTGFAQDRDFTIEVITPPAIISQPSNQTVLAGGTAQFTVGTAGDAQLFFQWQKGGTNLADGGSLSGTTTSRLTISPAAPADAGSYSVVVSNALNSITSSNATLTVQSGTSPGVDMTTLYNFSGGTNGGNPNGLIQSLTGTIYGTTQEGGAFGFGTVFQMSPGNAPTAIYSFTGGADGSHPQAALTQGTDGSLFGTAFDGGDTDNGTVFKITTNGSFSRLVSLNITNGDLPFAGVSLGLDGNFYGTTAQGGASGRGTAYVMSSNGLLTTMYSFTGGADGGIPHAAPVPAVDGNLYGTTFKGGQFNFGTIYKLATNGTRSTVTSFNVTNGSFPYAGLLSDEFGNLYGVASSGGAFSNGTVFKITSSGSFSTVYSFSGGNDGSQPTGGLIEAADGNFYGTTAFGGLYGQGTLFRLTPAGLLSTVVQFNGLDGANPSTPLLSTTDRAIYGTTQNGGAGGSGVIFRLGLDEGPVQFTSLPLTQNAYSGSTVILTASVIGTPPITFQWLKDGTPLSDGGNVAGSGTRVLTITNADPSNAGSYAIIASNSFGPLTSTNAVLQVIISAPGFTVQPSSLTLSPGANAVFSATAVGTQPLFYRWQKNGAPLIDAGNLSGSQTSTLTISNVTEADNAGYSLLASNSISSTPSSNATLSVVPVSAAGTRFTTLHSFAGGTDGSGPSVLALANDGSLYGTTRSGGAFHHGAVFRVATNGTVTNVASFSTNGFWPGGGVVQAGDGNFYGTTFFGGDFGAGNIYRMSNNGLLTNLYSFTGGPDGNSPLAPLLPGLDGGLYGSTEFGGNFGAGNIFRFTTNGVRTNLYSFIGAPDGDDPTNALMQASDGNFYGVTDTGGAQGYGTVFRLTPSGQFSVIYTFVNDNNGRFPNGPLVQGDDGALYGTTQHSRLSSFEFYGAIFRLTTNGNISTLYTLNFSDGHYPAAGLTRGPDGNFYGTTEFGGTANNGTVFRITPGGAYTTLVNFDGFDEGAQPETPVTLGADGNLYGTTRTGGPGAQGNIYRLRFTNAPQIVTPPAAQSVNVGATVNFSVGVSGSAPLSYQWLENGTNLPGSAGVIGITNRLLVLSNVATNQAGNYSVIVSNSLGSVTSAPIVLTVLSAGPGIASSPSPLTLLPGATAVFNVSATGNNPLFYQWRRNLTNLTDGGNISGSTTSRLQISNVTPADAGSYSVVVSNSVSSLASGGAALNVINVASPGTTLTRLYSFTGQNDGANPNGLAQGSNGVFYGTTVNGGAFAVGTVFQLDTNLVQTSLYSFTGGMDGANPEAALAQGSNGKFYGTTFGGGNFGGTIFTLTTNGVFSNVFSFTDGADGAFPEAGLVPGLDGNLYGTAFGGGSNFIGTFGTVFQVSPAGTATGLYSFTGGSDGGQPQTPLVRAADGSFYGTTLSGRGVGGGTAFHITTNGLLSTIHAFDPANEGAPASGLVLGNDGNLYGTTSSGGTNGNGTVFQMTTGGAVTVLYNFSGVTNSTNADGANPMAALTPGTDGYFYGTTANGGLYGNGTQFSIAPGGAFKTLAWFDGLNGAHPSSAMVQALDGNFYGTTAKGGPWGLGTVFRLGVSLQPLLQMAARTNGNLMFAWPAILGRSYQVQYATTLNPSNWQNLGASLTATNSPIIITDLAPANQQRYYRVVLLP